MTPESPDATFSLDYRIAEALFGNLPQQECAATVLAAQKAQAEWAEQQRQEYARLGKLRRDAHERWRLDQHCEVCGRLFNCDSAGKPRKKFVRVDKKRCHPSDTNVDELCLHRQKIEKDAQKTARQETDVPQPCARLARGVGTAVNGETP